MSDAISALRRRVGPEVLQLLEQELSPSQLSTLLLSVSASRAAAVTARELMTPSAFTLPAHTDPRALAALEHEVWQALPPEFTGLELSPVAPLGTCAVLGGVSQHRVMSTVRGSEVVADGTNVLAIEAARLRRQGAPAVDLAACHRLLRTQRFSAAGARQHFRLLSLVSSAPDRGSGRTEADLLVRHLTALLTVLEGVGLPGARVAWTVFREGAVAERLREVVVPALGLPWEELPERTGADYYEAVAFKVFHGDTELGDGGLTGWTAALLSNAKERCLISCLSTERMTALRQPKNTSASA